MDQSPAITWTSKLETGFPEIDSQHKTLIESLNRLHTAIQAGRGEDELGWCLSFLKAYTKVHFRSEEAIFAEHPEIDTARHIAEHEDLLARVDILFRKFLKGEVDLLPHTVDMLRSWLIDHIQGEDCSTLRSIKGAAERDHQTSP